MRRPAEVSCVHGGSGVDLPCADRMAAALLRLDPAVGAFSVTGSQQRRAADCIDDNGSGPLPCRSGGESSVAVARGGEHLSSLATSSLMDPTTTVFSLADWWIWWSRVRWAARRSLLTVVATAAVDYGEHDDGGGGGVDDDIGLGARVLAGLVFYNFFCGIFFHM